MSTNVYRYSETIEFSEEEPSTYYGWYISTSHTTEQYADFETKEARAKFVKSVDATFKANGLVVADHARLIERVAGLLYVYANSEGDWLLALLEEELGTLELAEDIYSELIGELRDLPE